MNMRCVLVTTLIVLMAASSVYAQGRGGPPGPPPTPKAAAKIDLTGYWVSLVTEDWRYRQFTPPKGDYESVPISAAGKKIADAWDPAKDEAAGEQCKAYGAVGLMRMPTRLHITWQDDNTLKVESDAGTRDKIVPLWKSSGRGWRLAGRFCSVMGLSPSGGLYRFRGNRFRICSAATAWWVLEGRHHQNETGISAEEWRAVQRENNPDRVLRPFRRSRRRFHHSGHLRDQRSRIPVPTHVDDHTFQERTDASGWKPAPCVAR